MKLNDFALERYFATHEFSARFLLSASDCEPLTMAGLLAMASEEDLARWESLGLGYTDSAGHPELRRRIAALYDGRESEEVLCAAPEEAIFVAMNSLLERGDRVVVLQPAYQSLHEVARGLGCEIDDWALRRTDVGWELDFAVLEQLLKERPPLLVINFPHNPTGFQPTPDELERIRMLAADTGTRIFSDEMYRGLEHGQRPKLPSLTELSDDAVVLSGLSKTYALPGLRVGWLVTGDREILERAQAFKDFTTICGSAPSEALALIALGNHAALAERSCAIVRQNLSFLDAQLDSSPALKLLPPLAGSVCLTEVLEEDTEELCKRALTECDVMVVHAPMFGLEGPYIRLGLGRTSFSDSWKAMAAVI